ncbi:hypothetical protein BC941DRAFT_473618 [Chlamydoabsidia padenii]|nr:hypothetical protein BC941DRAFT_473618 [Chlamydoabsidia padenii]
MDGFSISVVSSSLKAKRFCLGLYQQPVAQGFFGIVHGSLLGIGVTLISVQYQRRLEIIPVDPRHRLDSYL